MIIVGAGLAGLIAGHLFPNASIIERAKEPEAGHRALLRFRTSTVGDATGVPFRKVRVQKGIWHHRRFVRPSPQVANLYSRKVALGAILSRSIWDIEPADRYVAPDDFHERLLDNVRRRVAFDVDAFSGPDLDSIKANRSPAIISTAPLHIAMRACFGDDEQLPAFERMPIAVDRYRIDRCDVFQTIYFPSLGASTYRASITGNTLIVESMLDGTGKLPMSLDAVLEPFGIDRDRVTAVERVAQSYGKIAPVPEAWRREAIHQLSARFGIYSAGRFATWRNILLDDVVQDLRKIGAMIHQSDAYARRLAAQG